MDIRGTGDIKPQSLFFRWVQNTLSYWNALVIKLITWTDSSRVKLLHEKLRGNTIDGLTLARFSTRDLTNLRSDLSQEEAGRVFLLLSKVEYIAFQKLVLFQTPFTPPPRLTPRVSKEQLERFMDDGILTPEHNERLFAVLNRIEFYAKGEMATQKIIPYNKKETLGKGMFASVHRVRGKEGIVLKRVLSKNGREAMREFSIGAQLDHKNLVKFTKLYLKEHKGKRDSWGRLLLSGKIEMEEIQGRSLGRKDRGSEKLSDDVVCRVLNEAKDLLVYLFDSRVIGADINAGNILITQDSFQICDLSEWKVEKESKLCANKLMWSAMEIAGWLIRTSMLRANNVENLPLETSIIFPEGHLDYKESRTQVTTLWWNAADPLALHLAKKMQSMSDQELKAYLTGYFDAVIENFNTARLHS